ncbi:MAG: DUF2911 domain-containing protein [Flavobacteriales bacterium]|nr:DUF2911 domain-containing protein [Flavobacteriales bacterium]MCB9448032.1 DUF2911 domain-containing protein [Flavobacteriales bacterium]
MKKTALFLFAACMTGSLSAQDLPAPSPAAKVEQRVGLTGISVVYSSPAVKGRQIWGGLVPYGEVWRTGANKATQVTFSDDVTVAGQAVKAGSYALFTIPGESEWTVILSSNTEQWGSGSYKQEEDVLRIQATPSEVPMRERMTFVFNNTTDKSTELTLEWEKLAVAIPIGVDVEAKAQKNIEEALANAKADDWQVYRNAARYSVQSGKNLDKALDWINKAISIKNDSWLVHSVKADVLAALGKHKEAIESNKKAIELGEAEAKQNGEKFAYKSDLEKEIETWKSAK